jgi:uncharacterized membrane protein YkvA (DUF1232 family)
MDWMSGISATLADALAGRTSAEDVEAALLSEAPGLAANEIHELSAVLERYLNSLGDAVAAMTAMVKDAQAGRGVAFAAGSVLLYLVDDDDFLPESEVGAVGLLDDTYLVHRCIAALRGAFPQLPVPSGYEPPDERSTAAVHSLLPAGVADALDRTCESLARAAGLFAVGGGAGTLDGGEGRPPLRVGEALEAVREAR